MAGLEVADTEGIAEKPPEPLILSNHSSPQAALKSLSGLGIGQWLGYGAWSEVYKAERAGDKLQAVKINSKTNKDHRYLQANPNKYDVAALWLPDNPNLMKTYAVLVASKSNPNHCGMIYHPDQLPAGAMKSLYIAAVVSEFVVGETLDKIIKNYRIHHDHLIDIARKLAGALAHMHKHGFTHRDVSPRNIIYHPENGLKLIDMGSMIKTVGKADSYIGTTQLLAVDGYNPNRVNKPDGVNYDAKALDSWELGCVLLYCMTGKYINYYRPFIDDFKNYECGGGNSEYATHFVRKNDSQKKRIILNHLKPELIQKGIHPKFMNIVLELLRENPAERPSAEDVEKRLGSLQGNDNREGAKSTEV
ncbi:protein kinase domain-containing protein [Endozoicomonas lisbonensis]